jgi:hypothetical protein
MRSAFGEQVPVEGCGCRESAPLWSRPWLARHGPPAAGDHPDLHMCCSCHLLDENIVLVSATAVDTGMLMFASA